MSTPSVKPLNGDLVSPYAPKWARDEAEAVIETEIVIEAVAETKTETETEAPQITVSDEPDWSLNPAAVARDEDADALRQVERSLREMIAAKHDGEPAEPMRLSDVAKLAADRIALEGTPDLVIEGLRVPPSMVPRSLEPSPVPEPWPRPRTRVSNGLAPLFVRFGLAATGAAAVATLVVQDVPSSLYGKLRGPISELSTNAAAVFNQGKASMPVRLADMAREQERTSASSRPSADATVGSAPPDPPRNQLAAIKSDSLTTPSPELRKETVMAPWPAPQSEPAQRSEPAPRSEPAIWLGPAERAPAAENAATRPAPRLIDAEEIAILRKQGDQYIAAGDFVGARVVLERAAEAGDASAALALATTYDPVVLTRFKVRGLLPDIVKAGVWYERARELGSSEAPRRLEALARAN